MDKVVVFDLDDTLYKEIDFLNSAFNEIALIISCELQIESSDILSEMVGLYHTKKNVFLEILKKYDSLNYTVKDLLEIYRDHKPNIFLPSDIKDVLSELKSKDVNLGIITDGRNKQQKNKINALGLDKYIKHVIISEEFGHEKPHLANFKYFQKMFPGMDYFYVGDNLKKDFIAPNMLGWKTICLKDNGVNIHNQDIQVTRIQQPKYFIAHFPNLLKLIL